MNDIFDLWPFWLFLLLVLSSFLWNTPRPFSFHQMLRLELPAVLLVACLCAGVFVFFRYEPWFGVAGIRWAALYAPVAATVLSAPVIVVAAFIRYRRQRSRTPA